MYDGMGVKAMTKNPNIKTANLFRPGTFTFQTPALGIHSAYGINIFQAKKTVVQDLKEAYPDLDLRGRTTNWHLTRIE